jgi:hypothetical protein
VCARLSFSISQKKHKNDENMGFSSQGLDITDFFWSYGRKTKRNKRGHWKS